MSKYWDPAWEPKTRVFLPRPTPDQVVRSMDRYLADGWPDLPQEICAREDGLVQMGIFGPDYTILVAAPHRVDAAELQRDIGSFNTYFICTREAVRARAGETGVIKRGAMRLAFDVLLDDGTVEHRTADVAAPPNVREVQVSEDRRSLIFDLTDGEVALRDATLTAQALLRPEPYEPNPLDLEVRYIGRAYGALAETCALDRLESHEKYQRVQEEILASPHRNRDIWLVLASGTTLYLSMAHNTEDDLNRSQALARGARPLPACTPSRDTGLLQGDLGLQPSPLPRGWTTGGSQTPTQRTGSSTPRRDRDVGRLHDLVRARLGELDGAVRGDGGRHALHLLQGERPDQPPPGVNHERAPSTVHRRRS